LVAGVLIALFWADRLRDAARGMRTVADITRDEWDQISAHPSPESGERGGHPDENPRPSQNRAWTGHPHPQVTIVVPARNEEESVERGLHSLLALDYSNFNIIAVDDRSTDTTGAIMDRVSEREPRLEVLHIRELPAGWLGKPHAMWKAVTSLQSSVVSQQPEWFLFTDADVEFRRDTLRRAIAYAEAERADHLVLFPSYDVRSVGEKLMLSGFLLPFVFGHRPWKVADPAAKDFMGLGPFNLIRRSAYETVGGFGALRMEVIEDMKLGKLVKQHGLSQRNVFGPGLLCWRWAHGALGLSTVLTKNMFALMQFRWGKALGACVLLLGLNLLPLVGAIMAPGWVRAPFIAALACISLIFVGMGRRTPAPAWTFFFYPAATVLMAATMLRSIAHVWRHGGVVWRGTLYPIEELRKGMV
jgi:glycosyltransferase involved in cell wall biosynthesis